MDDDDDYESDEWIGEDDEDDFGTFDPGETLCS